MMRRRDTLIAIGGAVLLGWRSGCAIAQEPGRLYRVAFASPTPPGAPQWSAVLEELAGSGFMEGKNLVVDRGGLGISPDRMDAVLSELTGGSPDLIYCGGDAAIHAADRATKRIPIVATADDYLATGVIASLAHPGGNFTGVSLFAPELNGKRIELLSEMVPGIRRIAVLGG